jgi:hypothetical protein
MEDVGLGAMIDAEGFDSRYEELFGDLVALARSLGAGPDAEDDAPLGSRPSRPASDPDSRWLR